MSKFIQIECCGISKTHAVSGGTYATLCVLDGDDSNKAVMQRLQDLLFDAVAEDDGEQSTISTASLEKFIEFLSQNLRLSFPQIAITPEGYLYARWKVDRQKLISVQFLPDGNVRFVIFKPNLRHKNMIVRITGLTTSDSLMDEIGNHRLFNWVLEDSNER